VKLFEAGRVFHPEGESQRIAVIACGRVNARDWRGGDSRAWDVFDLIGLIRELAGAEATTFMPLTKPPLPFGAAVEIFYHGHRLGVMGPLHPGESRRLGVNAEILAAELDTTAWREVQPGAVTTKPLAKFPASSRDIAMVVPEGLPFGDVQTTLDAAEEPLLESAVLFDLFIDPSGERLANGKKSLAISLTFRAAGQTLTTEEVTAATERLKSRLKERLAVDFRE